MPENCTPRPVRHCEEELASAAEAGAASAPWSVCLPWGGKLYQDDTGIHVVPGSPPADGVYDRLVVVNGCIANALKSDAPTYIGSPCAPLPGGCDGSDGGGGGSGNLCNPSPTPGNLYKCDFTGRPLVRVALVNGPGVTVTGDGSDTNPYIISMSGGGGGSGGVYLRPDDDAISITGSGTRDDPYVFAHKEGLQTTANGLVFDRFGHLVDMAGGSANAGVQGLLAGTGIEISGDAQSGIYTVSLAQPLNNLEGAWALGGYTVQLDNYNRIQNITQAVNLGGEQTFTCGDKQITVSAQGTITAVQSTGSSGNDTGNSSGGELVASVLWSGKREWTDIDHLEADFTMPYDAPVAGFVIGLTMNALYIDGNSFQDNRTSNAFFTHPAVLSAGTHHIWMSWSNAADVETIPTPAMMMLFAVPNPTVINMWEQTLPWS